MHTPIELDAKCRGPSLAFVLLRLTKDCAQDDSVTRLDWFQVGQIPN